MSQQEPNPTEMWTVECIAPNGDPRAKPVDSRSQAEDKVNELKGLGFSEIEIFPPGETRQDVDSTSDTDASATQVVERVESPTQDTDAQREAHNASQPTMSRAGKGEQNMATHPEEFSEQLPENGPSVDEDPLVWMPKEFTDEIDDTIAINRKGFEVLAHHYEIQCDTELVVGPHETDYEFALVKATATDSDGDVYGAYGEAKASEDDMRVHELTRYADTRAYKRAISRATGVGMVAVEELRARMEQP